MFKYQSNKPSLYIIYHSSDVSKSKDLNFTSLILKSNIESNLHSSTARLSLYITCQEAKNIIMPRTLISKGSC